MNTFYFLKLQLCEGIDVYVVHCANVTVGLISNTFSCMLRILLGATYMYDSTWR